MTVDKNKNSVKADVTDTNAYIKIHSKWLFVNGVFGGALAYVNIRSLNGEQDEATRVENLARTEDPAVKQVVSISDTNIKFGNETALSAIDLSTGRYVAGNGREGSCVKAK